MQRARRARGSLTKATPGTFDALDESFQRDPFPTLSALRDQCAAFRDAVLPAVHVLRYAECQAILQNPVGFTNDFAWAIQPYLETMPELATELPPLFLATDGAEHHRLRSLANRAFSQRSVGQIEEHVHRLTEALVTEAIEQRDVDFIEAVAYPLPVQVIAEMLGLPALDEYITPVYGCPWILRTSAHRPLPAHPHSKPGASALKKAIRSLTCGGFGVKLKTVKSD